MKKRLFSLIIAFFMLCLAATSALAEGNMSIAGLVVKLAEYEQEDRAVLLSMSRSLLGLDSGVKMLKSTIKGYDGDVSDTTNKVIGRLLNVYSKEELISFLDVLKTIDEDTRYDFFTDIIERNGNPVTDEQKDAVNQICAFYLGSAYPDFQRICEEDGIDEGVIAKMLSVGKKINGGNSIYVDGAEKNTLAYNDLTDQYLAFAALKQDADLDGTLTKLNSSPKLVKAIMNSGDATGLYEGQGYIEDEPEPNTGNTGETGETGNTGNNDQLLDDTPGDTDDNGNSGNSGKTGSGGTGSSGGGNTGSTGNTGNTGNSGNTVNTDNTGADQNAAFSDIANHWSKDYVEAMAEKGVFKGYEDNTFRPDNALTRQEMAVTVVRVLGIEGELGKAANPAFSDDDKIAAWAKDYVYLLVSRGIFAGYADGSFGPDDLITREQFALVVSRISAELIADDFELGFTDNNKISSWAKEAVREMAYLKIVTGYEDNTFRPANSLTRAEACTIIYRYLNK